MIPRAVSTLLADAEAQRAQGWEFALTATYVEIYNERIRDLLNPANDNLQVSLPFGILSRVCLLVARVCVEVFTNVGVTPTEVASLVGTDVQRTRRAQTHSPGALCVR